MIVIKLWGGMCNQMFQYAFGLAQSLKRGDVLMIDTVFYNKQPSYVGKRSMINAAMFPNLPSCPITPRPCVVSFIENRYISHFIRKFFGCKFLLPGRLYFFMEKLHRYYSVVPYDANRVNYYDGYWQSSKYFNDYIQEVKRAFAPSISVKRRVELWRRSIDSNNCVAIHIRRGDYLNKVNTISHKQSGLLLDASYYSRAIDYMQTHLDSPVFCFFSDDINWCREAFSSKLPRAVFVDNNGDDAPLLDLFSIASCEHGIMSASTFSWWGNWLRNESNNSLVIAPKGHYSNDCFLEDTWIQL